MKYRYQKDHVIYMQFGKIIEHGPRKYPHEIHFDIKEKSSMRRAYPEMYSWLREEVGEYNDRWGLRTVNRKKILSFMDKDKAFLFKLTFDGMEKEN